MARNVEAISWAAINAQKHSSSNISASTEFGASLSALAAFTCSLYVLTTSDFAFAITLGDTVSLVGPACWCTLFLGHEKGFEFSFTKMGILTLVIRDRFFCDMRGDLTVGLTVRCRHCTIILVNHHSLWIHTRLFNLLLCFPHIKTERKQRIEECPERGI